MRSDKSLKLLKFLALGAVGAYLFQTYRVKGTLDGALGETKVRIDTDRLVDSVVPWMGLNGLHQEMVREGLKKFAETYKGSKK